MDSPSTGDELTVAVSQRVGILELVKHKGELSPQKFGSKGGGM